MAETMNLLERFERYLRNSGKSEKTIITWHYMIAGVGRWMLEHYNINIKIPVEIQKCTPDMMDEWFNDKIIQLSQSSKRNYVLAIQKYFEYLVKYNLIPENKNPTKILPAVKRPAVFIDTTEDSDRVYTPEEIKKMLTLKYSRSYGDVDDCKFRAIVATFLESGLRASELCSLTVGDIRHCKNNTIRVLRKGGKYNGVVIGGAAWPYIKKYYDVARSYANDADPFFITRRNHPYVANTLYKFVTVRQKELGIKPGLHNFRHTATSNVAQSGDMAVVRDFAGHANVTMTNRYTHTSIEDRLRAVDSTKMSKLLADLADAEESRTEDIVDDSIFDETAGADEEEDIRNSGAFVDDDVDDGDGDEDDDLNEDDDEDEDDEWWKDVDLNMTDEEVLKELGIELETGKKDEDEEDDDDDDDYADILKDLEIDDHYLDDFNIDS